MYVFPDPVYPFILGILILMLIGLMVGSLMGAITISSINRPQTTNSLAIASNITETPTPTPMITNT
ncbi:hypothetical protein IQ226_07440 [Dolichospermum sp. LEGE 00240]|uniref:hypothetical protein n=1 Tax=Dolichospermum sp. LEGE 00240 TaxID=1828603 RepID=UPI00187EBEA4|nr:hypothetical protein [Dolichospermum sp. LEGE 00240]MDM3847341.1 hypothetical protein [Aphanizomenon gracile PMC638.10]MDM3851416.1 hypothetical protein [Aphanizomenon gracile PMC627.10]MDM3856605.1 hypothetical protein [Aphanizomenon gracile PMC649.10]MDM3859384.1 hypothetical protein [Aphanizomenon gracile PMC644.10]MBE9249001.1 hypothetical protein [Dolichospermum sp. LEGE 00240]